MLAKPSHKRRMFRKYSREQLEEKIGPDIIRKFPRVRDMLATHK
ncbi:hypothetical protein F441_07597 [Phytophthora nicotianae CJ01A1]|uniref:Uncharacterized protein n=3 Tax=Phytophthora nicotianae TaxID=4792 RepID=W2Y0J2_PHYNI|nr:hypothetical protein L915_07444 [Phytophthora nicotianae]ETP18142.1 hypothetical protein F441_07597 [Phytophthora nicotianae CJ01A1]ETP28496.1 hypothetical protein F442_22211 [Phytophthora nicotianae P10297]ETL41689.1 hypothetical protein L916_07386 [Phytophthora nicotianae]ETL94847.1 hypothetical protein L917_07272 [Phytophthora nicotianae]